MKAIRTEIGGLPCVVAGDGGEARLAVILCHGFGAPGEDLVPLAPELVRLAPDLSEQVRFVFPQGPVDLGELGYGDARAWWMIDFTELSRAVQGGSEALLAYRRRTPDGLAAARRRLLALHAELARTFPPQRIVLGGFSQGAMLATDLALRLEEPPAALAVLSGAPVAEEEWARRAPARAGLPVLAAHGRQDPVLPYAFGVALRDLLAGAGLDVDFVPFDGGHGIAPIVLERLAALLERLVRIP